jgi:nitrogen fixation protein NifU and related proteins
MSSFYHAELIEHYKTSPHRKIIENPTIEFDALNPSCGDKIAIMVSLKNNVIVDIGFQGSGCVISQATTSMLCDEILGKNIEAVPKLGSHDILQLVNIELGPVRAKCALLCLQVLQSGVSAWHEKNKTT